MRTLNSLLCRHREHRRAWCPSPTHQKTVKTELPGVRGTSSRIARIEFPRTLAYTLVALFVLLYIVVYVSAPILIWTVGDHDDGLDMALGRHMSQGEWLGPYNQFTLLKGPGYPRMQTLHSRPNRSGLAYLSYNVPTCGASGLGASWCTICDSTLGNSRMDTRLRLLVTIVISVVLSLAPMLYPLDHPSHAAEHAVVRVAAAADTKFAFDEIVEAFRRQRPEIEVRVTYGSSGNFYAQLSNRAPYDMFLSADLEYARRLIREGRAAPDSEFVYGVGRLVVWVSRRSSIDVEKLGMEALRDPSVRKVAIANPAHAPYGRAAVTAMTNLGVYDKIKDRLVYGDSVMQAFQFVESSAADIGVVSYSLALAPQLRDKGRLWEIPLDAFPRQNQGGVILSWAQDRAAADALRTFMLGGDGKTILHRYGFETP
jgi:molybdate transport system substrate-binding protein